MALGNLVDQKGKPKYPFFWTKMRSSAYQFTDRKRSVGGSHINLISERSTGFCDRRLDCGNMALDYWAHLRKVVLVTRAPAVDRSDFFLNYAALSFPYRRSRAQKRRFSK